MSRRFGVPLVQDDEVIETLAAQGADHTLREGVHPWGSHRSADLADAQTPESSREGKPVSLIAIADEEPGCGVPREGVDDLLSEPLGRGVGSHVGEEQAAAFQAQDDEDG